MRLQKCPDPTSFWDETAEAQRVTCPRESVAKLKTSEHQACTMVFMLHSFPMPRSLFPFSYWMGGKSVSDMVGKKGTY